MRLLLRGLITTLMLAATSVQASDQRLKSIRDLRSVFSSPWKKRFFTLLGQPRSLDDIEHGMIRAKGAYDDPRIHMAVNCASIALRDEGYVEEQLDQQLEDQAQRFLSDPKRNRYSAQAGALEVSRIFDWYGDDFGRRYRGATSVKGFLAQYANLLSDDPGAQRRVREMHAPSSFSSTIGRSTTRRLDDRRGICS